MTEPNKKSQSLNSELVQIEQKILNLLSERTRLLAKSAVSRKQKNAGLADPQQEKLMWSKWRDWHKDRACSSSPLKKIFLYLNNLAYSEAENSSKKVKHFCLFPRKQTFDINIPGPTDQLSTQLLCHISALSTKNHLVRSGNINAPVIEQIKAINQCGGQFSWENDSISCDCEDGLSLDRNVIFVGRNTLNFFLLLTAGLKDTTRVKFTGFSNMKLEDMSHVSRFMPSLGARLIPLEPHGTGLPMRLEASGELPPVINISDNLPINFIVALIVNAAFFPREMTMVLPDGIIQKQEIKTALKILDQCGAHVSLEMSQLTVTPGHIQMPPSSSTELDALLSAFMLCLPAFHSGQSRLRGKWPVDNPLADKICEILEAAHLPVEIDDNSCSTFSKEIPAITGKFFIDISDHPELLPLVLPLALKAPSSEIVTGDTADDIFDCVVELLNYFELPYSLSSSSLQIRKALNVEERIEHKSWTSPDHSWTLAFVLASFLRPGICLTNPENLSECWPLFWPMYKHLPRPQDNLLTDQPNKEKTNDQPKPRRKRIIVS